MLPTDATAIDVIAHELRDDLDMAVVHTVTNLGLADRMITDPEPWPTYIDDEVAAIMRRRFIPVADRATFAVAFLLEHIERELR